jgi:hypothetical protein
VPVTTRRAGIELTTTQADAFRRIPRGQSGSYLRTAARGFAMVTLVSMNTRQLSTGHIGAAVVIGFLISLLWYQNSSKDRDNRPLAGVAYAVGAALGTWVGFTLAGWLAG